MGRSEMASQSPVKPALVVYTEIVDGDLKKLRAESNDSKTGGGARDLRIPWRAFRPAMHRVFSGSDVGRKGVPIRTANVISVSRSGQPTTTRLEYWPATTSRPAEDRVSKVHKSAALGGQMPEESRGKIFVLFILYNNKEVRVMYFYEDQLSDLGWAPEFRGALSSCIASTNATNATRVGTKVPVRGYYDFTTGVHYCNAK